MNTFEELGLSAPLLKVLPELGFVVPTEIQKEAIPILIQNNTDFIGLANTGTGKTAAFGLPLLDNIDFSINTTQALVLAPTRELGQQIAHQLQAFAKYHKKANITVVYGGANISMQIKDLKKGAQIVVATPGRLIDLLKRKALKISEISNVVLDEADEMLNMGFKDELDAILSQTPADKNTWLFSATMPHEIKRIVHQYMNDPKEISVHSGVLVNENINHQYVVVKSSEKVEALSRFIAINPEFRGVVFCRTKVITQELCNELMRQGIKAEALHGDLNQKQRDMVMQRFKLHQLEVLIATDVAARGIDVNNLTHVVHHSLPDDLSYYTHRSGRTARAGREGISLVLVEKNNVQKVKRLEKTLKISFREIPVPDQKEMLTKRISAWASGLVELTDDVKIDDNVLNSALELLQFLSKEELVKRLLAKELKGVKIGKPISNRSEDPQISSKKRSNTEGPSLFINLGSMDGISKRELINYVSSESKMEQKKITSIRMFEKYSFIDIDPKFHEKIIKSFKNKKYNGHKLRVNAA